MINAAVLMSGLLLLLGIASSKFSARLGVPVLVLFLSVGMLAGSEGLGRIPFENYSLAKPALALSTIGVLITSLITGLAAAWVLKLPLLQGLLVGSIVGSTDRKIAIGSVDPLSTSCVEVSRSGSLRPLLRSTENGPGRAVGPGSPCH